VEIGELNMDLDEAPSDEAFTSDKPMPNIWAIDDKDKEADKQDEDTSHSHLHDDGPTENSPIISSNMEDELERPSFLRRLTKRHKDSEDSDTSGKDK
jgi:hypothetical protein